MRHTVFSDYALRLLMYLAARPDQSWTIETIAKAYGISRHHMMKLANALVHGGFITGRRGRSGGLQLAKPPVEIRLGDVLKYTEDDFTLVECFDPARNRCVITPVCRLKGILSEAMQAYIDTLNRYSVADLVAEPDLAQHFVMTLAVVNDESM